MARAKVLITGGAGNIGGSLARHLSSRDRYDVLAVDNLETGSIEKLPPSGSGFSFIRADVNFVPLAFHDVSPVTSRAQGRPPMPNLRMA